MAHYHLNLDSQQFLKQHWQQQPLFVANAFSDFIDPITPDELAGLALEPEASSRVIVSENGDWRVVPGPVSDFEPFGDQNWQLLLQACNHFVPDAQALADCFDFLPQWRFDDLMASFATIGGGVGPHIDNYDVFIIQGSGRRRWQVGDKLSNQSRNTESGLDLVNDFTPIIDVEMSPGDLLYIPKGYPHCGQTLTESQSYSVGFRSPSQQELLSHLADHLLEHNLGQQRLETRHQLGTEAHQLSKDHLAQMRELMQAAMDNEQMMSSLMGQQLSQNRFELALQPPELPYQTDDLLRLFDEGHHLHRIGGLKCLLSPAADALFVDGDMHKLSKASRDGAELLAKQREITPEQALLVFANPELREWLTEYVNLGYWYLE
ncbi:JmjC domain-containing protein [Ferrimonas aestuarii]|uniref:Cupin domain-containing protein n=1 Tax=Ferrimonas aestuarii TaxID=2569539 RepID=A0A4U1BQ52_9GAMM|nr:cupin domain-containing protein [Ferrimonas aestuarii]TKB53243.1 cupin domain-containing protein [Ferrimonas aestuarii]